METLPDKNYHVRIGHQKKQEGQYIGDLECKYKNPTCFECTNPKNECTGNHRSGRSYKK